MVAVDDDEQGRAGLDHDWWVRRLTGAARSGAVLDLSAVEGSPDLPGAGAGTLRDLHALEPGDGWQLPPDQDYPAGAHVPASAVRQVLLDPNLGADRPPGSVDPRDGDHRDPGPDPRDRCRPGRPDLPAGHRPRRGRA